MKTFFEFKDYLTPGRERVLQAADIEGRKLMKGNKTPKDWVVGQAKKERALAILNRAAEPSEKTKEAAKTWRKLHKFWK